MIHNPSLTPDQDGQPGADDVLGRQLDQYLDALASGTPLPTMAPDAELERLQTVVERLHGLAGYLAALDPQPAAEDRTTDVPAAEGHPEQLALPTDSAQPRTDLPLSDITCQYGGAPPRPAGTPEHVGKYEVLRALGDGGQATAYLAFDPDLRRRVVLKLYHAARTPQEQETVLKEGRALARVRSPYVAQCYSAERHDGVPYLVMEYIPGKNLAELQRSKPVTIDRALELTGQLAEGLAAVHACGLLHRDVKPSNILVGDDGVPRLVDFGLAEALAGEGLGRVSGTLPYMAPEQARGESDRIDPRSDLFGLGAVLYELLTTVPPHQGKTRQELLQAACDGDVVPARQRNPKVPPGVNDLCMRCLAKSPDQRFATATDLAQALLQCRPRRLGLDLTFGLGRFRFRLVIGTAVALLLLVGVIAVRPYRSSHPADQVAVKYHPESDDLLGQRLGPAAPPAPTQVVSPAPPGGEDTQPTHPPPPRPGPRHSLDVRMFEKSEPEPRPERPLAPTPRRGASRHPLDKHELRRDFAVKLTPLTGKVESDGRLVLAPGENKVRLKLEVSRDAFVSVWSVKEDGTVAELVPGPQGGSVLFRAGEPREISALRTELPTRTQNPTTVEKPEAEAYFYVLASSMPLDPPGMPGVGVTAVQTTSPPARTSPEQKKRLQELLQRTRPSPGPAPPGGGTQVSEAVLSVQPR